ncbi:MAG TPA: hypothetical protein VIL97_02025 [Thermoanaerobaculia bacterium]
MTLWRNGTSSRCLRCEVEQLGESCFELRVLRGNHVVVSESFADLDPLFRRAEELKLTHHHR